MSEHPRNRRAGFTLIELMIVVVLLGILTSIAVPNYLSLRARAKEAGVSSNAHTLQLAAEDFAAQNDSQYATDFTTALPSGQLLLDLLPVPLENPFDATTSATCVVAPDERGEVGYETAGLGGGYRISGLGHRTQTVITLRNGA